MRRLFQDFRMIVRRQDDGYERQLILEEICSVYMYFLRSFGLDRLVRFDGIVGLLSHRETVYAERMGQLLRANP